MCDGTTLDNSRMCHLCLRLALGDGLLSVQTRSPRSANLMVELDDSGVRIGVQGARRNAWASGMQRDMARGFSVYLLSLRRTRGRPPTAQTFASIAVSEAGTLAEQDAFHEEWLASLPSA